MENHSYFYFPLNFLTRAIKDHKVWDKIISYSIVDFVQRQDKMSLKLLSRKILYCYYRNRDLLLDSVYDELQDLYESTELEFDNLHNGFFGSEEATFHPPELDTLISLLKNNPELEAIFRKNEQILTLKYAEHKLNYSGGNFQEMLKDHSELKQINEHFELMFKKDAIVSIKTSLLFEVRNGKFPIEEFLILAAIKTIIGRRNYNLTTVQGIVKRACGAKSNRVFKSINKGKIKKLYDQISKRYPFNKHLDSLVRKEMVAKISPGRGLFVTTSLDVDALQSRVVANKKKYHEPKKKEQEAARRLRAELSNTP